MDSNKKKKYINDYPELMKEWDYAGNDNLNPKTISSGYRNKVQWKCSKCGFLWRALISNRINGKGCPVCGKKLSAKNRNKTLIQKKGSLQSVKPDIAKEWHPTKNGTLTPADVTPGSNKKVWWKCEQKHEWQASINHRTNRNQSCPYCSGRKAISGENDLQTLFPSIANEWDYKKTLELNRVMLSLLVI